jgi:hypothetical protein
MRLFKALEGPEILMLAAGVLFVVSIAFLY